MQLPLQNYLAYDDASNWTLAQEQVKSLYNSLPVSLLSSILIAMILSLSHWRVIGQAEIILWNLLLGSSLIARLTLWIFWQNTWQLYSANFWLWSFRIGVWSSGAAWGATAFLLFAEGNSIYQALLSFSLAGVVAGSTTSLAADKYSSIGFVVLGISPLSLIIYLEEGPTAIAMSGMTLLFIAFVITSSARTRLNMEEQIHKNEHLLHLTNALNYKQQIDKIINNAQSILISDNNIKSALQALLRDTLTATHSSFGFISQVDKDSDEKPFMRALIFSGAHKDQRALENFQQHHLPENGEYRNLDHLFGIIMQSNKPVISHDLSTDTRAARLPEGHPEIKSFIGIPVFNGRDQVAILGLANPVEPYQLELASKLEPILKTIAQFIQTMNHERRHAQDRAALEASNQHTQTILNDIADGIITINKNGVINSFNQAAETIFGYRARQIIGKNLSELMFGPYKAIQDDYIRGQVARDKKNMLGIAREVIGLRRNGQQFPMDLMVSRVYQNSEPVFIAIVRDITDKKQADELRYQFVESASREILEPLNHISEAIQSLKNKDEFNLPDPVKTVIDIAYNNSFRLQRLIHDLIEIQRLSKDEIALQLTTTPILPLIEEVVRRNKTCGEGQQSKAIITASSGILLINVDVTRFYQAMTQLLQFAFRRTPPQKDVNIKITDDNEQIKVIIEFINECLSEGQQQNISWHFLNRPNQNTVNMPEINDLGLAIANEIIERMQGAVNVESRMGKCYFVVNFPRATDNA